LSPAKEGGLGFDRELQYSGSYPAADLFDRAFAIVIHLDGVALPCPTETRSAALDLERVEVLIWAGLMDFCVQITFAIQIQQGKNVICPFFA